MESEDLADSLKECLGILDENIDVLSDITYEIESSDEEEIEPGMNLCELLDMTEDVASTCRIKNAEDSLLARRLL